MFQELHATSSSSCKKLVHHFLTLLQASRIMDSIWHARSREWVVLISALPHKCWIMVSCIKALLSSNTLHQHKNAVVVSKMTMATPPPAPNIPPRPRPTMPPRPRPTMPPRPRQTTTTNMLRPCHRKIAGWRKLRYPLRATRPNGLLIKLVNPKDNHRMDKYKVNFPWLKLTKEPLVEDSQPLDKMWWTSSNMPSLWEKTSLRTMLTALILATNSNPSSKNAALKSPWLKVPVKISLTFAWTSLSQLLTWLWTLPELMSRLPALEAEPEDSLLLLSVQS